MTVRISCGVLVALFLAGARAHAQEDEARAIVAKAVRAHGGDKLFKIKAVQTAGKAMIEALGVKLQTTDERWVQFPDRIKWATQFTAAGVALSMGFVYDGKKGWIQALDQVKDMDAETLKSMREDTVFLERVAALQFAKEKGCKLSVVGEGQVEDRPALGVRLECDGHPAINLYFDAKTHLLVKWERRTKSPAGQEITEERYFREYKEVNGIPRAFRVVVRHDGVRFAEWEATDQQVSETAFAENFFARP
jgi:hypothetical protein